MCKVIFKGLKTEEKIMLPRYLKYDICQALK